MPDLLMAAPSAFAKPLPNIDGLHIEERTPGLATIMMKRSHSSALAARAGEVFGLALPEGPQRTEYKGLGFIGTGPGTWLAVRDKNPEKLATDLALAFDGLASVSDQSSGYTVLRLTGPRARRVLQAGLPVDLDPGIFGQNHAAVSLIAHIGMTLWQTGPESFELAFFRSMADSVAHWLETQTA